MSKRSALDLESVHRTSSEQLVSLHPMALEEILIRNQTWSFCVYL